MNEETALNKNFFDLLTFEEEREKTGRDHCSQVKLDSTEELPTVVCLESLGALLCWDHDWDPDDFSMKEHPFIVLHIHSFREGPKVGESSREIPGQTTLLGQPTPTILSPHSSNHRISADVKASCYSFNTLPILLFLKQVRRRMPGKPG